MTRFGFVIHPLHARDAARKYPIARFMTDGMIEAFLQRKKPFVMSKVTGVRSITGVETEGWFIACPLTPKLMTDKMRLEAVYERIAQCAEIAKAEGADLIGLGAFTSVVGDGGITVEKNSPIPVTTGNSYTVATSIEGAYQAAHLLNIVTQNATLAVVGATGSIGKTCALAMSPTFARTILVGRDLQRTQEVAAQLDRAEASTDPFDLQQADVIVTVTSADAAVIMPEHLRPGALVCDVARPRDVSVRVQRERSDVLVVEGGVVSVPGDVHFGIDFGFPPKTAYACMCETMMLALENRPESYTLGKDVALSQVKETTAWATKHGFHLAGFRAFERAVDEQQIEKARAARLKLAAV